MAVHGLFAYLHIKNAAAAIEFYKTVFDVTEKFRLVEPDGRIGHAELEFNGTTLMISGEYPDLGIQGPDPQAPASMTLHLHVDNCDALIARAVQASAKLEMAAQDHFYGERSGSFRDPFGHRWNVGHSIEEVAPEEMQKRYTAMMQSPAG